jgi:hypothetical protein
LVQVDFSVCQRGLVYSPGQLEIADEVQKDVNYAFHIVISAIREAHCHRHGLEQQIACILVLQKLGQVGEVDVVISCRAPEVNHGHLWGHSIAR